MTTEKTYNGLDAMREYVRLCDEHGQENVEWTLGYADTWETGSPDFDRYNYRFRIRPRTVTVTIPIPETKPLKDGQRYWFVNRGGSVTGFVWDGSAYDRALLEAGNIYLRESDAQARADAFKALVGGGVK